METTSPKKEDNLNKKIKYDDSLTKNEDNLTKKRIKIQTHWAAALFSRTKCPKRFLNLLGQLLSHSPHGMVYKEMFQSVSNIKMDHLPSRTIAARFSNLGPELSPIPHPHLDGIWLSWKIFGSKLVTFFCAKGRPSPRLDSGGAGGECAPAAITRLRRSIALSRFSRPSQPTKMQK